MRIRLIFLFLFIANMAIAQQKLRPGFDAVEYAQLLAVTGYRDKTADSAKLNTLKKDFRLAYRSPEVGMKNRWTLYVNGQEKTAVIFIRGTVENDTSWLANYYFAMIPAQGTLQIARGKTFHYKLAANKHAAVHAGWTVSLGFMAEDIEQKIIAQHAGGISDFYIFGHSQGGAIAYLLRSYLHYRQQDGTLPKDIFFKTYCSAAPKPGNINYAYDYDFINRGPWAFNVVNTVDWVPETPYTVQAMRDMYPLNPLVQMRRDLKDEKLFKRIVGRYLIGKVEKRPRKAQQMFTDYFGHKIYKYAVSKALPGFKEPQYAPTVNYIRAGTPVILMPDEAYFQLFDEAKNPKDKFLHHSYEAYYYLLKKDYLK